MVVLLPVCSFISSLGMGLLEIVDVTDQNPGSIELRNKTPTWSK
ncbi:hypothetical protein VCHA50P420_60168 [Vibrio chagasii]|nr:hypothetical protein VCHA31O73_40070 [Vibrio chagasii]CAH7231432.1 hypothetical protein VCHA37P191_20301 [Vibrio chagasii]CAH7468098.1 hypothetical protein VCHA37O177_60173 [Vibrio chagasii]CAH7472958.1 hypothetical protein VCHA50P420_60168 [Vibrio chagasii]